MKVFQRTYTKPLPVGAKILNRRGGKVAQFYGQGKRIVEAKLTESGDRVLCHSKQWFISFEDGNGVTQILKCLNEEGPTRALADKVGRLLDFKATGQALDPDLRGWLEGLPGAIHSELVRVGLLAGEQSKAKRQAVLLSDLLAGFERYMRLEKEASPKHVQNTISAVQRMIDGCGFVVWGDIQHERLRDYLLARRDAGKGISKRTFNRMVQAAKQFCEWAVDNRDGIEVSPLRKLAKLKDEQADRRRERRAIGPDGARRLLEATQSGPEREGMDGAERALLYRFILETGLRVGECRSLLVSDLSLDDSKSARVTVRAVNSKHRKPDPIPIRPPLAAALLSFIRQRRKLPGARVFGGRFESLSDHVVQAMKQDLAAAGIAYRDEDGKYFDLHSCRYTFVTRLGKSGLDVDTVRKLARHSSIAVTQRYMDTEEREKRAGIENLPDYALPSAESAARTKTGTGGVQ